VNAQPFQPLAMPCAWTGEQMKQRTDWVRPFTAVELREIDAALQAVKRRGLDLFDIDKTEFLLPEFSRELAKISQELETGRGMIMLRGLPLTYTPDDLRTVYWGIGSHLGTAVSQDKSGELLGVVKDFQIDYATTTRTSRRGFKWWACYACASPSRAAPAALSAR
jgi:hypothetical protein